MAALSSSVPVGVESYFAVEGSRASAIHVLQYFYVQAHVGSDGTPGIAKLTFTIDEHGVTPITIQSTHDGLRQLKDAKSHCRLQVVLGCVPPREDITLVSGRVPIIGAFDDLPEGSEVTAVQRSLHWQLTYKGGTSGHDLVLRENRAGTMQMLVTRFVRCRRFPAALGEFSFCMRGFAGD